MTNAAQRADLMIQSTTDLEIIRSESMKADAFPGAYYWKTDDCEIMVFPDSSRAAIVYNGNPIYGEWDDDHQMIILDDGSRTDPQGHVLTVCADCGQWKPASEVTYYKRWVQNGMGGNCCQACGFADDTGEN